MTHRLDPLLKPGSIAVLGATERPGTVGRRTIENLQEGGFTGALFAVNPGYDQVCGVACYPRLADLPETAEHVIFAIGDRNIEAALDDAIEHGARSGTMMSSLVLRDDGDPPLRQRIEEKIGDSKLLICGANGMGFYNFQDGVWACGFDTRKHRTQGSVALISHSGSGMSGIVDVDERIDFSLAVSTGQELCVSMDEYLDFALDQEGVKVVGLFMETVRNPRGMRRALEKANRKNIPIVALTVGRTELSAKLTVSHSGAIAGSDTAYEALFDEYGVQRVEDMDELATALVMFAQPHPVPRGGLVTIHDSGGERQLLIDLADQLNVQMTTVSEATVARLEALLDPGLVAVNPLDAWSAGGEDADEKMAGCLEALMADPDAAIGAVVHDRAPWGTIYTDYLEYLRRGHGATGKPAFLVANRQGTGADTAVIESTRCGLPVLDGLRSFLIGVRCLFAYRDFLARDEPKLPDVPEPARDWRARLSNGDLLDEVESGQLLADFGLPVNPSHVATDSASALAAARKTGYPVALKTAEQDIHHKTDVGGIKLGLENDRALENAYADLADRLGPRALVSRMIENKGTEMILGLTHDEQFGPLITMGFGGTEVEAIRDVVHLLPPFDATAARRRLDTLRLRPLLDAHRGQPAVDLDAFCQTAAMFSMLASTLGDVLQEIDVNPVIVHVDGCIAVDAFIAGRKIQDNLKDERREK
ncbi:MAG: acetate--CoA ligase family protein [Gammaproteobacteria bacterium]